MACYRANFTGAISDTRVYCHFHKKRTSICNTSSCKISKVNFTTINDFQETQITSTSSQVIARFSTKSAPPKDSRLSRCLTPYKPQISCARVNITAKKTHRTPLNTFRKLTTVDASNQSSSVNTRNKELVALVPNTWLVTTGNASVRIILKCTSKRYVKNTG